MNEVKIFENEKFGKIRIVDQDNEPWFVGKDVAVILGYANPQKAIRDHVDEEDKGVNETFTPGGTQKLTVINESGLYSLILSSKLPTAKEFKHWVTAEVLSSIRKTGGYVKDNDLFIETYLPFADEATKLLFRSTLDVVKAQNQMIKEKDEQLQIQAPKVEFANKVSNTKDLINMGEMAKLLRDKNIDIGRNRLFSLLRNEGILMKSNIPYQSYIDKGYFEVKEAIKETDYGDKVFPTTYVTGKGQLFLCKKVQSVLQANGDMEAEE